MYTKPNLQLQQLQLQRQLQLQQLQQQQPEAFEPQQLQYSKPPAPQRPQPPQQRQPEVYEAPAPQPQYLKPPAPQRPQPPQQRQPEVYEAPAPQRSQLQQFPQQQFPQQQPQQQQPPQRPPPPQQQPQSSAELYEQYGRPSLRKNRSAENLQDKPAIRRGKLLHFERRKDKLGKQHFYVFVIEVQNGEDDLYKTLIYRRLSEFRRLFLSLKDEFPNRYIPPLQVIKESFFTSYFNTFEVLTAFFRKIEEDKDLRFSVEFQKFLNQSSIDQILQKAPPKTVSSHVHLYVPHKTLLNGSFSSTHDNNNKKRQISRLTANVLRAVKVEYPMSSHYEFEIEVTTDKETYVVVKKFSEFLKLESELCTKYHSNHDNVNHNRDPPRIYRPSHLIVNQKIAQSYANSLKTFLHRAMHLESNPEKLVDVIHFLQL